MPAAGTAARGAHAPSRAGRTSLSIGFLAMLPMLAAYELARGGPRNTCEFLLTLPLSVLGTREAVARWAVLAALGLWSLRVARAQGLRIRSGVARVALEGVVGALVIGPVLVSVAWLSRGIVPWPALAWSPPALDAPTLDVVGRLWGSGAWEELFFRVGLFSLVYLLVLRLLELFGEANGALRIAAESAAVVLSALAFAAFHLELVTGWIGPGGERFDAGVFAWRALAGALLALLFRWRGPGVAAWTHGLFNLALLFGIGPDVLL